MSDTNLYCRECSKFLVSLREQSCRHCKRPLLIKRNSELIEVTDEMVQIALLAEEEAYFSYVAPEDYGAYAHDKMRHHLMRAALTAVLSHIDTTA